MKRLICNGIKFGFVFQNRYLKEDLKKMEKEFNSLTKKNLELSEKNRNLSVRLDQVGILSNYSI